MADPVVFTDIQAKNRAERERIEGTKSRLERERAGKSGPALQDLEGEIAKINEQLAAVVLHPMVEGVRKCYDLLTQQDVHIHEDGQFDSQKNGQDLAGPELAVAALCGMLAADHPESATLADVASALAEYLEYKKLYNAALDRLIEEGSNGAASHVRAEEWITIARRLRDGGIAADDDRVPRMVRGAAVVELITGDGRDPSAIRIDLPNLDARAHREIVRDNLLAMQAIYFAAILEQGNVFSVVDTLVDPLNQGLKGVSRGRVSDRMTRYWAKRNDWLSATDRAHLFTLALGLPDLPNVTAVQGANTGFPRLIKAFVDAVVACDLTAVGLVGAV